MINYHNNISHNNKAGKQGKYPGDHPCYPHPLWIQEEIRIDDRVFFISFIQNQI